MAWTPDDIVRSIRRYLAMTLPTSEGDDPRWRLRVERREVRDEDRPVGVIISGPLTTSRARNALIQGNVEEIMPVTITLYPPVVPKDGDADSFRQGRLDADKLRSQLSELVNTGLTITTKEDERTRHWAGPFRLPLWDYAEVPLSGKEKAGPKDPHDVLWVVESSLSVEALQDPEDPGRWSVIANFRVSIERPGRVPPEDETFDVKALEGSFAGEPPPPE